MSDWGFVVRDFEQTETKNFLRGILKTEHCVPFIGTGFTGGEKTRTKKIPFGKEWMEIMKDQIIASSTSDKPTESELKEYSFQELSDAYFRKNIVDFSLVKETINNYFTNTTIENSAKISFLNVPWPYLYTLNIDDGIEKLIDAVPVLPNRPFARHETRRFVYKLHGDASEALTASELSQFNLIFGKADYIKSLKQNHHLLNDLSTDFAEKNIMFIGCSLSDEVDIAFALAEADAKNLQSGTARIYVTSSDQLTYRDKTKLSDYGITDIIVCDYSSFYNFVASVAESNSSSGNIFEEFALKKATPEQNPKNVLRYMLQEKWSHDENCYQVSISREKEKEVRRDLNNPMVVVWGRRFSGKTTLITRALFDNKTRKNYFIPSSVSASDKILNNLFSLKDSIIAFDSDVLRYDQIQLIRKRIHQLQDNNLTVIIVASKGELGAFGVKAIDSAIELSSNLFSSETREMNAVLGSMGFKNWNPKERILDNIFSIAASPIVNTVLGSKTSLQDRIQSNYKTWANTSKWRLELAMLFYIAIRQRLFSKTYRMLAKAHGLSYMENNHLEEFSQRWAPFVELENTDTISNETENSNLVLLCNSYAWLQYAVRGISEKAGVELCADTIVKLYTLVKDTDGQAYLLIFFDNLNSMFEQNSTQSKDWRSKVIRLVYEKLAGVLAQSPDYWLQRAKSVYHNSEDADELRAAIAYCEKSIMEKEEKANINSRLTKANLLGKLCSVTKNKNDEYLRDAIFAYVDALEDREKNSSHIDLLLKKSRYGKGYMRDVVIAAQKTASLLPYTKDINLVYSYIFGVG